MKVAIIGGGNMGGAIARGLAKGSIVKTEDITVSDPSRKILDTMKAEYPAIRVTSDNNTAIADAHIVLLAVKPWLVEKVLPSLKMEKSRQILISIAAGITFEQLIQWTPSGMTIFRLMPNTGIAHLESMTIVCSHNASKEQELLVLDIFNEMGLAMLMPEQSMPAVTALASCGIAYALKYIQAAMQAGIELGLYPKDAQKMVAQSVKGAAALLLNDDTHPSIEIDKVCTPGGVTIKGVNELEHEGFSSAVIKAMKASCVK